MKHLLLLHGAVGAKDQWEPAASTLAAGFRVHLLDFPGHGGQETESEFSIPFFADAVLQWQAKMGIDKVNLAGYSMGGYVAMYLAVYHPQRVEKIVTLGTKYEWNPDIAAKETAMLQPGKIEAKVPQFAAQLRHRHTPADWKQVVIRTTDMLQRMGDNPPLENEDFTRITAPVLLLVGDRDKMVSLQETINVFIQLPNAQLGVLPGTTHQIERINLNLVNIMFDAFFQGKA